MSKKGRKRPKSQSKKNRKYVELSVPYVLMNGQPSVVMNDIPDDWEPRICRFHICLATATKTVCQEPDTCTEGLCRELVSCDEHADLLAAMVMEMISHPERAKIRPESEAWGGHD